MPNNNSPTLFFRFSAFVKGEISGWSAGEIVWILFCQSAIVALSVFWGDSVLGVTAAVAGMMYTLLAGKGKISCYVFGLVNTPLYAWLSWRHGYYGDMALNVYYFVMMFPGLFAWSRNLYAEPGRGIVKTRLGLCERLVWAAGIVLGALALWPVLAVSGGARPLCDAFTNTLSVAAMMLTVKRCIEQWILWIVVDTIEIFMWYDACQSGGGAVSVLLMWILFLINGIYLFRRWKCSSRETS